MAYRITPSGLDAVDFLLAAGPAEPLRPLAAVASGGESARIMMALKAAPAAAAASVVAACKRQRRFALATDGLCLSLSLQEPPDRPELLTDASRLVCTCRRPSSHKLAMTVRRW